MLIALVELWVLGSIVGFPLVWLAAKAEDKGAGRGLLHHVLYLVGGASLGIGWLAPITLAGSVLLAFMVIRGALKGIFRELSS